MCVSEQCSLAPARAVKRTSVGVVAPVVSEVWEGSRSVGESSVPESFELREASRVFVAVVILAAVFQLMKPDCGLVVRHAVCMCLCLCVGAPGMIVH